MADILTKGTIIQCACSRLIQYLRTAKHAADLAAIRADLMSGRNVVAAVLILDYVRRPCRPQTPATSFTHITHNRGYRCHLFTYLFICLLQTPQSTLTHYSEGVGWAHLSCISENISQFVIK